MADTPNNGAAPAESKPSLRDVAEAAYEQVVGEADAADAGEQPSEPESSDGRARDERGRFVARTPAEGEAAAATPPSPEAGTQEPEPPHPAPAQPGEAAQAPANWSAEDRANFEKLPQEGREFLLRRHSEMESDYQKRVQASAFSNQFVTAVSPVFNDPDIVASMRQQGLSPEQAVHQWGAFHKRAVNQDDRVRIELLFELADRMQLDPAAVFGHLERRQATAFTKEELANPAVKKFADHIGYLNQQLAANNAALQKFQEGQSKALFEARRADVDYFANAKNADGSPAHPYFDWALPIIMDIYGRDPSKTIEQCYQEAVTPILGDLQARAKADVEKQQNLTRAQAVVRSNVRGSTAPVAKPADGDGKKGLRATIEAAADEIGI
jgi:Predicted membrane protein